jgi:hypothetical protein
VDLYIHSPIHLHGVVLNYLSTGTTLLLLSGNKKRRQRKSETNNSITQIIWALNGPDYRFPLLAGYEMYRPRSEALSDSLFCELVIDAFSNGTIGL